MNCKRIFLVGSNGLVGQAILKELKDTSFELIATSFRPDRFSFHNNYKFEILDITNSAQVNYFFDLYKPDFIINCAAISQVDFCEENKETAWDINVNGVKNIAEAASRINAHIIHLSSDFIFDGIDGMYKETDVPNPVSFYGVTKLESEKVLDNYKGRKSIVRTVLVYGLNYQLIRSNIVTWVIDSLKANKKISVVNDQYRTPTLDSDLAKGIISIIENNAEGIFHLSGNEYLSVYDFALRIAEVFSFDKTLISPISSLDLNQIGKRPAKTGFDISKARNELNFNPLNVDEGLNILKDIV